MTVLDDSTANYAGIYPELGAGYPAKAWATCVSMFAVTGQHATAHVDLEVGTNVLYGLNGSGKSSTLAMLKAAFGIGPSSPDSRPFVNVQISSTDFAPDLDEDSLCNFLDDAYKRVVEMCNESPDPSAIEKFEGLADFDLSGRLTPKTSIGGAVAVALIEAGWPRELAVIVARSGRFLIRDCWTGGAELYIGLPVDHPSVAPLWQAGAKFYRLIAEAPELPATAREPDWYEAFRNAYDWIADEMPANWKAWAQYMADNSEGDVSYALCALLLVLGHLQRSAPPPPRTAVPIMKVGTWPTDATIYTDPEDMREDLGVVTDPETDAEAACAHVENALHRAAVHQMGPARKNQPPPPLLTTAAGRVTVHEKVSQHLSTVSESATELLRTVLGPSAPELVVELDPDQALRTGRPIQLWALDEASGRTLNVRELSDAYRRWSLLALRLAQARASLTSANLLLLDEPDASLHVLARKSLGVGLAKIVKQHELTAFVTTHSPDMLDNPGVRLWHTSRANGLVNLSPVHASDLLERGPEEVGLRRSDVLLMTRAWLVVEGDHDEAVFDAWLGDELRRHLVRLVRMRGTHNLLSILDAQLVFEATDAHVCVVTDRTRSSIVDKFNDLLDEAANPAADRGRIMRRLHAVVPQDRRASEEQKLLELAVAAVRAGVVRRLTFKGLTKPDIIEYLPAEAFVPGESWESLVMQWKSTDRMLSFKRWLAKVKQAKVTTEALRAAAANTDHVPTDLTDVLHLVCRSNG
jgi:ABC-type molybdenum transport system ATPase subunit/photorepair protein PhrA